MEIRNLTTQDVVIVDESGKLIASYPAAEQEASVSYSLVRRGVVDRVVIYSEKYRNITNLPEWQEETLYIVTPQVAEAARDSRVDLLIPNSPVDHKDYPHAYQSLIICNAD